MEVQGEDALDWFDDLSFYPEQANKDWRILCKGVTASNSSFKGSF